VSCVRTWSGVIVQSPARQRLSMISESAGGCSRPCSYSARLRTATRTLSDSRCLSEETACNAAAHCDPHAACSEAQAACMSVSTPQRAQKARATSSSLVGCVHLAGFPLSIRSQAWRLLVSGPVAEVFRCISFRGDRVRVELSA
jgi:hypothetical protein